MIPFQAAATDAFGTERAPQATHREMSEIEARRELIYSHYLACSQIAVQRQLTATEIDACGRLYLRLKLSFVEDLGLDSYETLSAQERGEVNRQGYAAYKAWVLERVSLGN